MVILFKQTIIAGFVAINIAACANNPIRSYKDESDKTLSNIYSDVNESAVHGNASDPDILYHMEHGSHLRMRSKYAASDKQFAAAQSVVDTWVNSWKNSTRGELTTTTKQMLINDNAVDYQPKGYEKTMLATYRALNHVDTHAWSNARIEIKKMYQTEQAIENYNQALYITEKEETDKIKSDGQSNYIYQQIMSKYNFADINSPKVLALKNSYQSAFSHYLAGFVFEALNEPSLSRPGYVKAGQLNPHNKLPQKSIDNIDKNGTRKPKHTNLLIIEEIGHAPQFKSNEFSVPFNYNSKGSKDACINSINVFFPTLHPDTINTSSYTYSINGQAHHPELFTDYNLMAARYLHDQMPHIIARNIAAAVRNIASSQASCSAGGSAGTILSLAAAIGGMILDRADERTWVLLPSKVYLNQVQLPYGKQTIKVMVNGHEHVREINLSKPYQIVSFRVLGNKVFFNTM
jgi:uncharacterized protein